MQELTKEQLINAIFKAAGYNATFENIVKQGLSPQELVVQYVETNTKLMNDLWEERRNEWKKVHERALKDAGTEIESRYIKVEDLRKLSIGEIADKIAEIDTY